MKRHQLVWRQDKAGRGKYKSVELVLPADHHILPMRGGPTAPYHAVNVGLEIEAPPGSEFLLPTFISPGQRKLLWATLCSVLCFGAFAGIVFTLVVLGWSSDGDILAEDQAVALPSNVSDNCTLTYDPDDISELTREAYVRTFFNLTCLATNSTGDPCDLHLAEEYTHRMFSALRFDRLVMEFLAFVAIFSLAQIGGIPRPTDWNGMFFWLAWMATMLAQYVVILCALILQVFTFLGVRARLSPCLIALCHYYLTQTIVLGTIFSMWAAADYIAAVPGVALAWVLALLVAVLVAVARPWQRLDEKLAARMKLPKRTENMEWARYSMQSEWVRYKYEAIRGFLPYNIILVIICIPLAKYGSLPLAILPLSVLFMLVVQLAYFFARHVLAHIGPGVDGSDHVWVELPEYLANRCCCKWTDNLAGPTRTCLSWIQSTSIFSHVDGVLGRSQGNTLAFTSTSYATLAGGLSCFWVLLALAPVASHTAWASARSLMSSEGVVAFANDTTLAVGDMDSLTGKWSWAWASLMVWLLLGATIVLSCGTFGIMTAQIKRPGGRAHLFRTRWRWLTAFVCSSLTFVIFVFTAR